MHVDVMWSPWEGPGLEHLRLTQNDDGILAESIMLGLKDGEPFRVRYEIRCDIQWTPHQVTVELLGGKSVKLQSDGNGHWLSASVPVVALDGCIDVDISATPFTNTLPIKRLELGAGISANINVAYISVPDLDVRPLMQQYTCLVNTEEGGLYRFRSLASGFIAELPTDSNGLVIDYPQLWTRAWSR